MADEPNQANMPVPAPGGWRIPPLGYRFLAGSIALIALLTALVCTIGLKLTVSWYRNIETLLLDSEKRAAEHQARELERGLEVDEQTALARLAGLDAGESTGSDPNPLDGFPAFRHPFRISADGRVEAPRLRGRATRATLETETLPDDVEAALRFAASAAPLRERVHALERLAASDRIATPWRVRAALRLASLQTRSGHPDEAVQIFEQIDEEHGPWLEANGVPPWLFVQLGYLEALAKARRGAEIFARLEAVAVRQIDGRPHTGLAEEEFFIERARALLGDSGVAAPSAFERWRDDVVLRRRALIEAENLRDWLLRHSAGARDEPIGVAPQHYFTRASGALVPIVWSRASSDVQPGSPLAVGFQIDLDRLRTVFRDRVRPDLESGGPEIVFADDPAPASHVPLASLGGDLHFVRLGLPEERWSRRVREAERPFLLAAVSVALTGVVVLAGLVVLYRGVRRQFKLSRMKTEFVANVSHELKTPLALIRLCSETLLLDRLRETSQRHKYLEIITRESVRLGHLIANMLEFSVIEAGRKTYRLEPSDLAKVARDVLDAYCFHLDEKGFTYETTIPESLPPVLADDGAVAQALINLLQNAIRYSSDRKRIEVCAEARDGEVRISVRDSGDGIPPAEQKRIWEDYYRTGAARARTRGSGLGLAVVRHIMRGHRGRTELESSPGSGSTFTLIFPLASERALGTMPADRET